MKSKKLNDIKYRKHFKYFEKNKILLKFLYTNLLCNSKIKNKTLLYIIIKLNCFNQKFYKIRTNCKIKNRCIFTNRSSGTFRKFSASRFILRDIMQFGLLPGFKKSVW